MKYSDKFLDEHRDINVSFDDWHEHVFDGFAEEVKQDYNVDIEEDSFRFSGFYSQGDGASFGCIIDESAIDVFVSAMGGSMADYPMIEALIEAGGFCKINVYQSGSRYCHEETMTASITIDSFHDVLDSPTELHEEICEQYDNVLWEAAERLEHDILSECKELANKLYRRLEETYEYLTSDEAVAEALEANDIHEDEECA